MKKLLMLILSLSMATVAFTSCDLDSLFESASVDSSNVTTSSEELPSDSSETPSDSSEAPSDSTEDSTDSSEDSSESTEPEKQTFTVTFQQAGQADVVLTVEEGATVAAEDIPTPVQETGYTIVWNADELAQLNNVSANVVVSTVKTANTYNVTFETEGVDAPAAMAVTYNTEVVLDALEREGYNFDGWFIKDTATQVFSGPWTIANDVTLVAKWTEKGKATITFVYADGTVDATTQVYVNDTLTDVPNPQTKEKVGYTVAEDWYIDSECTQVANFANIAENMTVYAKATAKTYTITYAANGGTVESATQDVVYDSEVTLAVPTRYGYIFKNWKDAAGNIVANGTWKFAEDVTLTADWTEMSKATITFVYADGTSDDTNWVYVNETLENVPNPQDKGKTGYTVDANWYTDTTYTTVASFDNIAASMMVYAKATANTYTITYNTNGGTVANETQDATYDSEVTLAVPTRDGYIFNNWTDGDNNVVVSGKWTIAGNVTLTANWTEKDRATITFAYADGTNSTSQVYVGDTLANVPSPTEKGKVGYTVDANWYTDNTYTTVANFENIQTAMMVYAKATANTYTITYNANDGTVANATQEVVYDSEVTLAVPTREHHVFNNWKDAEGNIVSNGKWTIASDVTLTAYWTEYGKATITFVYADGTTDDSTQVYVGYPLENVPNPQDKGKTGYTVDANWYTDTTYTTVASFDNIAASMMVYAKATANTYTITYNANGGAVESETQAVKYDAAYTLAVPTRANYTFNNWTDANGNVVTDGVWTTASDITLTANWTENAKATITFVYADGTTDTTWVYVGNSLADDQILDPTVTVITGYTIDANWYTDNTYTTVANFANITASMTVYAKATAKTYTVQLNADGGTGVAATLTATYGEEVTVDMPTKAGYTFNGWYDGDTFVAKDSAITWNYDNDNMTLTAKWTAKSYTITLNLNGGACDVTTMTVTYGAAYELPTPVMDEYMFIGWKYNGTVIANNGTWTYDAGETIELVAEWKPEAWTENY